MDDKHEGESPVKAKLTDSKAPFGAQLVPKMVFIMRTKKDSAGFIAKVKDEMKKDLPFVPDDIIDAVIAKNTKNACDTEVHSSVVAEQDGQGTIFLAEYRTKDGKKIDKASGHSLQMVTACESGHADCVHDEDTESLIAQTQLNNVRVMFKPDWAGERELPAFEWEGDSMAELETELNKRGYMADFMALYPDADFNSTPVSAAVPSIKAYNRKELVKRFGEKRVAELEAKIGIRKLKIKKEE